MDRQVLLETKALLAPMGRLATKAFKGQLESVAHEAHRALQVIMDHWVRLVHLATRVQRASKEILVIRVRKVRKVLPAKKD